MLGYPTVMQNHMNILVTGGAGYVGSVCTEELLREGHTVVVIDNLTTGHQEAVPVGALFAKGDFGDKRLIGELVRAHGIEAVMHFAGETLVAKSMTDPQSYFQTNIRKGVDFLGVLLQEGVRKLIFSSTAAVYGEPKSSPITEDHPKQPINAYGESKLMFERILEWYQRAYGFLFAAPRYFNAAGASQMHGEDHMPETHLIPLLLQSIVDPSYTFIIHGDDYPTPDGTCIRDYVHVLDIARAHILALYALKEGSFSGPFNIGSNTGHSVREVLRAVENVTGKKVPFEVGAKRSGDPAVLVASHERLRQELEWEPKNSNLENIIDSAWRWRSSHANGYERSSIVRDDPEDEMTDQAAYKEKELT
jgi:UDP-glucose 4-epimerase